SNKKGKRKCVRNHFAARGGTLREVVVVDLNMIDVAYYIVSVIAMAFMGFFLYHWWGLLHNVREDKRMLANFLAPFVPFIPGMFTDKGIYHRERVGRYLICLLILLPLLVFIDWLKRG